ncbi:hypothetical protein RCL1_004676 [Eukaryota sp. TZLM3-RCL]
MTGSSDSDTDRYNFLSSNVFASSPSQDSPSKLLLKLRHLYKFLQSSDRRILEHSSSIFIFLNEIDSLSADSEVSKFAAFCSLQLIGLHKHFSPSNLLRVLLHALNSSDNLPLITRNIFAIILSKSVAPEELVLFKTVLNIYLSNYSSSLLISTNDLSKFSPLHSLVYLTAFYSIDLSLVLKVIVTFFIKEDFLTVENILHLLINSVITPLTIKLKISSSFSSIPILFFNIIKSLVTEKLYVSSIDLEHLQNLKISTEFLTVFLPLFDVVKKLFNSKTLEFSRNINRQLFLNYSVVSQVSLDLSVFFFTFLEQSKHNPSELTVLSYFTIDFMVLLIKSKMLISESDLSDINNLIAKYINLFKNNVECNSILARFYACLWNFSSNLLSEIAIEDETIIEGIDNSTLSRKFVLELLFIAVSGMKNFKLKSTEISWFFDRLLFFLKILIDSCNSLQDVCNYFKPFELMLSELVSIILEGNFQSHSYIFSLLRRLSSLSKLSICVDYFSCLSFKQWIKSLSLDQLIVFSCSIWEYRGLFSLSVFNQIRDSLNEILAKNFKKLAQLDKMIIPFALKLGIFTENCELIGMVLNLKSKSKANVSEILTENFELIMTNFPSVCYSCVPFLFLNNLSITSIVDTDNTNFDLIMFNNSFLSRILYSALEPSLDPILPNDHLITCVKSHIISIKNCALFELNDKELFVSSLCVPLLLFCFYNNVDFYSNYYIIVSEYFNSDSYFLKLITLLQNYNHVTFENFDQLFDRSLIPSNQKMIGHFLQSIVCLLIGRNYELSCSINKAYYFYKKAFKFLLTYESKSVVSLLSVHSFPSTSFVNQICQSFLIDSVFDSIQKLILLSISSSSIGKGIVIDAFQWLKNTSSLIKNDDVINLISSLINFESGKTKDFDFDLSIFGAQSRKQRSILMDFVKNEKLLPIFESDYLFKILQTYSNYFPSLFYLFLGFENNNSIISRVVGILRIEFYRLSTNQNYDLQSILDNLFLLNDLNFPLGSLFHLNNSELFSLLAFKISLSSNFSANICFFVHSLAAPQLFKNLFTSSFNSIASAEKQSNLVDYFDLFQLFDRSQHDSFESFSNHLVNRIQSKITSPLVILTALPYNQGLLLSRLTSDSAPLTVNITGKFDAYFSNLDAVLDDSLNLLQKSKDINNVTIAQKSDWWKARHNQDSQIQAILANFERSLSWGKMIFTTTDSVDMLSGLFQSSMSVKSNQVFSECSRKVSTLLSLMKSFLIEFPNSLTSADFSAFKNYLLSIVDHLSAPKLINLIESSVSKFSSQTLQRSRSVSTPEKSALNFDKLSLFLITDPTLANFPLESLNFCSNFSISRFFNLFHLSQQFSLTFSTDLLSSLNPASMFYAIDPQGDLPTTLSSFNDFINQNDCEFWSGIKGGEAFSDLDKKMGKSEVFLYCGHGAGESLFPNGLSISPSSNLKQSFLMGCSSSKLIKYKYFDPDAYFLNYFTFSCSSLISVVGCLWDITDKDLDRITYDFLKNFFSNTQSASSLLPDSRSCSKLRYLTGAAPIVWGLPLTPEDPLFQNKPAALAFKTPKVSRHVTPVWAPENDCLSAGFSNLSVSALDLTPRVEPTISKQTPLPNSEAPLRRSARIAGQKSKLSKLRL